jgi:branched-chain amino acid transport system permease protein
VENILQIFVSGIISGTIYALVASGFLLVFKSSKIFNFAQGDLLLLLAYISMTVFSMGLPLGVGLVALVLFAIGMGICLERFLFRPLMGQPLLSLVMMTLVLSVLIRGICYLLWRGDMYSYQGLSSSKVLSFWGVKVSIVGIITLVATFAVIGVCGAIFKYTKTGLAMRTMAEDSLVARSLSIRLSVVLGVTWAGATLLAGLGGLLLGANYGIGMHMSEFGLRAIPAALLGGLESLGGVVVGGLILGIAEQMTVGLIDPMLQKLGIQGVSVGSLVPYIVIVAVLLVKPYGLFGLRRIERV